MKSRRMRKKDVRRARATMKKEAVRALKLAFARNTGWDQHARDEDCSDCRTWCRAIDAVKALEP